jgi:hypothetical protein
MVLTIAQIRIWHSELWKEINSPVPLKIQQIGDILPTCLKQIILSAGSMKLIEHDWII